MIINTVLWNTQSNMFQQISYDWIFYFLKHVVHSNNSTRYINFGPLTIFFKFKYFQVVSIIVYQYYNILHRKSCLFLGNITVVKKSLHSILPFSSYTVKTENTICSKKNILISACTSWVMIPSHISKT